MLNSKNRVKTLHLWLISGCVFITVIGILGLVKILPIGVLGWYLTISLATYLLYAYDKQTAKSGGWRVQEATLHKLSFAGGWVGAALAHYFLRHKSQKPEFRKIFYMTAIGNLVVLGIVWFIKFR